jgi:hypothetical protein
MHSKNKKTQACKNAGLGFLFDHEWSGPGLNRRHMDFQSIALPTELPDQGPSKLAGLFPVTSPIGRRITGDFHTLLCITQRLLLEKIQCPTVHCSSHK